MRSKGSYFLKCLVSLLIAHSIQGCGLSSQSPTDSSGSPENTTNLSGFERTTALKWTYGSGALAPAYSYTVTYTADFQSRILSVFVSKGASVTVSLPSPGTRALSDAAISTLRNLLSQVRTSPCASGSMPMGGGQDNLQLFSTSLTSADSVIFGTSCQGLADPAYLQGGAGYQTVISYLQTL